MNELFFYIAIVINKEFFNSNKIDFNMYRYAENYILATQKGKI